MRRLVVLLLVVGGALASARAGDPRGPERHETLENGLDLVVLPSERARWCGVLVGFRAGSRREQASEAGAAQLVARLLRRSACGSRAAGAAEAELAALGPRSENGPTSGTDSDHELTWSFAVCKEESLAQVLDVERARLTSLAPTKELLEDVRGALLAEPVKRETRAWNALIALAFPESGLGRPRLGKPETVSSLSLETLEAWRKAHIRVDEAVVVLAGVRDAAGAAKLVREKLGTIPRPDAARVPPPAIPAAPRGPARTNLEGPVTARHVWLAFRGPEPGSEDEAAFLLATLALKDRVVVALQGKAHEAGVTVDARSDAPALLVVSAVPRPGTPLLDVEARARGAANLVRTEAPPDLARLKARLARVLESTCTAAIDSQVAGAKDEPRALVDAALNRALAAPLIARRAAIENAAAALTAESFVERAKVLLSEERASIVTVEPPGK